MRHAASHGVAADAQFSRKLLEQAERLRAEKREEKDARAKKGGLSFKEKEKRKRNAGMQSSCASLSAALVSHQQTNGFFVACLSLERIRCLLA